MAEIPYVRLRLSSRPENVVVIRQALSGLADGIGLDPLELNDISTAVSEACNNVVRHAYIGEEGPLEVEVCAHPAAVRIAVRDRGGGIQPSERAVEDAVAGIGLPVIRALADSVELGDLPGGGTEVRITFATGDSGELGHPSGKDGSLAAAPAEEELPNTVALVIGPTSLARAVLPRVACALAARAHFSTDRISDLQLLSDVLASNAEGSVNARNVSVSISVEPRNLELRIGPLHLGRAGALLRESAVADLGPVIERLSDGHHVSPLGGTSELLSLQFAQRG
jgi:serine/threonine-protein kinase RsbW